MELNEFLTKLAKIGNWDTQFKKDAIGTITIVLPILALTFLSLWIIY